MNKNTKRYLTGVAFGFLGMMMYTLSLMGYENVYVEDVITIAKQMAMPFIFTELWVAIGVEGLRNFYQQFVDFKKKLNKKLEKKGAEA